MGERTGYEPGTFCWVDLQISDPEAAKAFYGELLGWDYAEFPIGEGASYSSARVDGRDVAAVVPLAGAGMPPHWNCYVSVTDADATAARARDLGATIVLEPGDVGDSARLAVLRDPQGALVSLWQPGERFGAQLVNAHGALAWNDLLTSDPASAADFYGALLGWEIAAVPGSDGRYWSIVNAGTRNGGLLPSPPQGQPGLEPLLRCARRRRDDHPRRRARRLDGRGADGCPRGALRRPARPAGRAVQRPRRRPRSLGDLEGRQRRELADDRGGLERDLLVGDPRGPPA